jgi:hypothetical protein
MVSESFVSSWLWPFDPTQARIQASGGVAPIGLPTDGLAVKEDRAVRIKCFASILNPSASLNSSIKMIG